MHAAVLEGVRVQLELVHAEDLRLPSIGGDHLWLLFSLRGDLRLSLRLQDCLFIELWNALVVHNQQALVDEPLNLLFHLGARLDLLLELCVFILQLLQALDLSGSLRLFPLLLKLVFLDLLARSSSFGGGLHQMT